MSDSTANFRETYDHTPGPSPGTGRKTGYNLNKSDQNSRIMILRVFYVKLLSRGPGGHQNQMMIAMVSQVMFLKLQLESCFVLN